MALFLFLSYVPPVFQRGTTFSNASCSDTGFECLLVRTDVHLYNNVHMKMLKLDKMIKPFLLLMSKYAVGLLNNKPRLSLSSKQYIAKAPFSRSSQVFYYMLI